jgi:DNA-binding MarR family transcriptional regulator
VTTASVAERQAPEYYDREDCPACLAGNLSWLLAKAHHALATELSVAFTPLGITPRGHAVLSAAATGPHSQKALADMVGLDKTTMVAAIDELERGGLARRVLAPNDRRAHVIEVTAEGRRMILTANQIVARVQADVLEELGGDRGDELLVTLFRLVSARRAEPASCRSVRRDSPM